LAGYKISYNTLHEQGLEYTAIGKELAKLSEEILTVNKQLSENSMFVSVRSNLSTLVQQLQDSELTLKTAGEKLVVVTEKFLASENKSTQMLEETGVTKKDFYGSVDTISDNNISSASDRNMASRTSSFQPGLESETISADADQILPEATPHLADSKIGLGDLDKNVFAAGLAGATVASATAGALAGALSGKASNKQEKQGASAGSSIEAKEKVSEKKLQISELVNLDD